MNPVRNACFLPSLLAMCLAGAGCGSLTSETAVPQEKVLAGPYELRLSVAPKAAQPGERVTVTAEFENTGSAALWVPRQREMFLGYRQAGAGGEMWSSSCDGIQYVRLPCGEKLRYELSFEAPRTEGVTEIYTSIRRDISVPLLVTHGAASPTIDAAVAPAAVSPSPTAAH